MITPLASTAHRAQTRIPGARRRRVRATPEVRAADDLDITKAAALAGYRVSVTGGSSDKLYCPVGRLYHPDHGIERAMRIYPGSNSAWCFACQVRFTPTQLLAATASIPLQQAATTLLAALAPASAARSVPEILAPTPAPVDHAALIAALNTRAGASIPDWATVSLSSPVLAALVSLVPQLPPTQAAASKWLTGALAVLQAHHGVSGGRNVYDCPPTSQGAPPP